jgi:hypothetical protein
VKKTADTRLAALKEDCSRRDFILADVGGLAVEEVIAFSSAAVAIKAMATEG